VAVMEARHAEAREARAARAARRLEAEKQLHRQLRAGDLRCLGTPEGVSGAFPSLTRFILTEIYLCHACYCQEIEDDEARRPMLAEIYLCHACS
jgi:hypothetical protein